MRTISLTQPWASLVACGFKLVETRSWSTAFRGPLAIHAAKTFPSFARHMTALPRFSTPLGEAGYHIGYDRTRRGASAVTHDLPLGAVIAICRLSNCIRTEQILPHINAQERAFGDYSENRWAWVLADVVRLPEPIPATGALGLWTWEPELERAY